MEHGIESLFKVIRYEYKYLDIRKLRYPTFKVECHEYAYFKTLDEAESRSNVMNMLILRL